MLHCTHDLSEDTEDTMVTSVSGSQHVAALPIVRLIGSSLALLSIGHSRYDVKIIQTQFTITPSL